ncbi:DUF6941 family protein [Streptomyces sp. NPDC014889]|uniref:DUF6941 family protein n=1 Tax=Streptomyces sp. NPDC014889 TaxID=3364928 RepID=UPI0036FFDB0D
MKLNMVALCDRATIREGLLHILGAGVTQCSLGLPSPPDLDLAILIQAEDWQELAGSHRLTATMSHVESDQNHVIELMWDSPRIEPDDDPAAPKHPLPQLPVVVPLRSIVLTQEGEHSVEVAMDGSPLAQLSLIVTKAMLPGVTTQLR